jgi:hypothetical protein
VAVLLELGCPRLLLGPRKSAASGLGRGAQFPTPSRSGRDGGRNWLTRRTIIADRETADVIFPGVDRALPGKSGPG